MAGACAEHALRCGKGVRSAPSVRAAISLFPRAGRGRGEGAVPRVSAWQKTLSPAERPPQPILLPACGEKEERAALGLHNDVRRLCDSANKRTGNIMAGETRALARFAAGLRYDDIPAP